MKKKFLDSLEVKAPCSESWDEMIGNNEVRFCSHCAKDVHNLSEMTRTKAEKLLEESNGKLCVRYVKTPNGKLITAPPKFINITRRATIAASVLATSLALSTLTYAQGEPIKPKDNSTQTKKDKKDESKQEFSTILGAIKDEQGAVIPGVKITLRDPQTNKIRFAQSNYSGAYEVKDIEPGIYELVVENPWFETFVWPNINLMEGYKLNKDIVLKVLQATTGVVAIVEDPPIQPEFSKLSEKLIEQRQILELSRNKQTITMGMFPGSRSEENPGKEKPVKPKKKKN